MAVRRMTSQTMQILIALMDDLDHEWYGLELSNASGLKSGTIYPALARLEQAGVVTSSWEDIDPETAGRPRRRLYRLTANGVQFAKEEIERQRRLLQVPSPAGRLTPNGQRV